MTATIRHPDSADLAALSGFFAGLSMRTRVQRFFAPVRPTPALVRLACSSTDALVATLGGVIVGHAMAADQAPGRRAPLEGRVTEIGVVVADAWQGRGVGSALVQALISRAQARGVTSVRMDVLPANRQVLDMIASHWTAARTHRAADCVIIEAALPPERRAVPPPAGRAARRLLTSA